MSFIPSEFVYGGVAYDSVEFGTLPASLTLFATDLLRWHQDVEEKGWIVETYVLPTLAPGVEATDYYDQEHVVALYNPSHYLLAFYWIAGRETDKKKETEKSE